MAVKHTMYQRKVGEDMLNAVKSVLADVSSASPSSEQKESICLTYMKWILYFLSFVSKSVLL